MDSVIDVLKQKVVAARNDPKKNDSELIVVTKETLKDGSSDYFTLYLTSVVALDEIGIAYDQVGGGVNLFPWDAILRVHVRGKELS